MTPVVWAAIGITLGAAILHAVLGLRRPLDRAHLGFASMMGFLALYFYLGLDVYRAQTVGAAVEAVRAQVFAVLGCHASMLLFVPAYTNTHLPYSITAAYWGGLGILFTANVWTPYGLWFSGPPELIHHELRGEHYHTVIAPPMSLAQHSYAFYFTSYLGVATACALRLYRRGERQRSLMFAVAVLIVVVTNLIDLARDSVRGSLPYIAEFGFVAWALIMSVQLARDFRAQARALAIALNEVALQTDRLNAILEALRNLERNMLTPIGMLEAGIATLASTSAQEAANLQRIHRAVTRLRSVARSMVNIRPSR